MTRLLMSLALLAGASLGAQVPNPLGLPDPLGISKPAPKAAPAPRTRDPRRAPAPRRDEGRRDGDRGHHGRGKAKGHRKH